MLIKLLKNQDGFITGFISHLKRPLKYPDTIEIPDADYKTLFYFLVGRDHVKQKGGIGSVKVGGISFKDEGDFKKEHLKLQKDVFKFKPKHQLN